MKKYIHFSVSVGLVISSITANATLTPRIERGDKNVYFTSPNGVEEVCVIPKHYPEGSYKKKDLKKEEELCSYSFYPLTDQDRADGKELSYLEPKLNSTNPGVNIMQSVIDKKTQKLEEKKIGKYKNSTSCSYTPSILSYYHISRILGGIARVPPSVLRTMNIETHKKIAAEGVAKTKATDLIHQTWTSLQSFLKPGSSRKDLLMTDDGLQSYGAFIVNPKHEAPYKELFTSAKPVTGKEMNMLRAEAFREANDVFKNLKNQSPLEMRISSTWNVDNVQKLLAMRDASEFILLDHILDQQDRFGNIAFQTRVAYIEKDDKEAGELNLEWANDMEEFNEEKAKGQVITTKEPLMIKSMILKDNDCGVSKTNVVKAAGLLKQVAHMQPKTYKKLVEFSRTIEANATFFTSNLFFTANDFKELVVNVKDAAQILQKNCQSGDLRLDLDLETYLTDGSVTPASCDVP